MRIFFRTQDARVRSVPVRTAAAFMALAVLSGSALVYPADAAPDGVSEAVFRGDPLRVSLEPGRLTELVFPRSVLDVASGDEVAVRHLEGDSILYLRPAKPRFETSLFVRLDGGYSVPVVIGRASIDHPTTISLRVRIDPAVRPSRNLIAARRSCGWRRGSTSCRGRRGP